MSLNSRLISPDLALKLAHSRQQELIAEFELGRQASKAAHRRFMRMFRLRRVLNRWAPGLVARIGF